jgi:hypothetical protein
MEKLLLAKRSRIVVTVKMLLHRFRLSFMPENFPRRCTPVESNYNRSAERFSPGLWIAKCP